MATDQPVQLFELDLPRCANVYGTAPCTAAVGVTGARKCFNTLATCQDVENFDGSETLTLRFAKPQLELPAGWACIPSLQGVSTNPTELNVGGGSKNSGALGARASINATFQDHPYSDLQTDPYVSERDYNPFKRGTFWGKLLARNPFYQNRVCRVRDGYLGQAPEDMRTRLYFVDQIDGPDASGRVQVRAKDVLKLADNERAEAPAPSTGRLFIDIDAVQTEILIEQATTADYPAPGTVRIGDEVMTYTGVGLSGSNVELTGIIRGTDGTEASGHNEDDNVQLCLRYTNTRPDLVVRDLLTTYGFVPVEYLDDWEAEASIWLTSFAVNTLLTEPEGVLDLIGELLEQCLFYIWWDEVAQLIKLRAIRPEFDAVMTLDERANILMESASLRVRPEERVSLLDILFDRRDPTKGLEEPTNYRRRRVRVDADAESADQYGERRVKRIFSRWLTSDAQVIALGARLLARYRDNPRFLNLALAAKDRALWTGDIADVTTSQNQDETGAPLQARWQVISANEVQAGEVVQYVLQRFQFDVDLRFAFYADDEAPDYPDAPDRQRGAWYAGADGLMSDGSQGYRYL